MKPVLLLTNTDSNEQAERIADALLEQRLAAAVQIVGPVASRYRWEGKVHTKQEWVVWVKTGDARLPEIEQVINAYHSYELPSMLSIAVAGGEAQYLQWWLAQSMPQS